MVTAGRAETGPLVSVVVSTYRRPHLLPPLFAALDRQTIGVARFELVIVDDASLDDTATVLAGLVRTARFSTQVLVAPVNGGPAAGRNRGWRNARAEVVAFTDDDCTPAPGWLSAGLSALQGRRCVVVGRTVPDPTQHHQMGPFSRTMRVEDSTFLQTCNIFYRRADLVRVEGFNERLRRGEDTELGLRVTGTGVPALFASDALVYHRIRPSRWRSSLREAWSWVDVPLVVKLHPDMRLTHAHWRVFWKRSHPPTLLALAALAAVVGSSRRPARALLGLLALPWLRLRLVTQPLAPGRARRVAVLPGALAVDAVEVAAMVRGSVRHRALFL